jgi:hypothetical protein
VDLKLRDIPRFFILSLLSSIALPPLEILTAGAGQIGCDDTFGVADTSRLATIEEM